MKQDTQTNQTKPTNKSNETQTNKIKYQCNLDINTFYTNGTQSNAQSVKKI